MAAFTAGCSGGTGTTAPSLPVADEAMARSRFAELQAAVKEGDADKLWSLMDGKSRADAEREAGKVKAAYAQAGPEDRAKLEEALGLTGSEVAGLTGKGVLGTKRFKGRYHEVPDSTIEKVVIEKESVAIHFLEPDGDHEKIVLVPDGGQWKFWLTTPRLLPS
jgi:hypothetical protein